MRRAGSVRRTSSIDVSWPGGRDLPMTLFGRARDIWTELANARPAVLAEGEMQIVAASRRNVLAVQTKPDLPEVRRLVAAAGKANRVLLGEIFTETEEIGTPLYLLLDDYFGATLVAEWAWSRWVSDWMSYSTSLPISSAGQPPSMEGVCAGFRPGSSALIPSGESDIARQNSAPVPPLLHPADPDGWHAMPPQAGVGLRRARRIDVWLDAGEVHVDYAFQDSATTPAGGRVAVHEYLVAATADVHDLVLTSLHVEPRVLPYAECPTATPNAQRMVGTELVRMRATVSQQLAGTLGCTHLNDILRSLADVPRLAREIQGRTGR